MPIEVEMSLIGEPNSVKKGFIFINLLQEPTTFLYSGLGVTDGKSLVVWIFLGFVS